MCPVRENGQPPVPATRQARGPLGGVSPAVWLLVGNPPGRRWAVLMMVGPFGSLLEATGAGTG
jgi:hypothetical protein